MCGLIGSERGEGEKGEAECVCGHVPSSLATPFITLLSQLQTKPQCGASLLKSQHDKNSGIEVAQPTLPWHMGFFLGLWWGSEVTQSLPKHITSFAIIPMIGCPSTQTLTSYCDTLGRKSGLGKSPSASPKHLIKMAYAVMTATIYPNSKY